MHRLAPISRFGPCRDSEFAAPDQFSSVVQLFSPSALSDSAGPIVRGYWPKKRKVGNESVAARSDLPSGEVSRCLIFSERDSIPST